MRLFHPPPCATIPGMVGLSLEQARGFVRAARRIVALTGAGISTPSGIPDFRSPTSGVWHSADPAIVASLGAFKRDPQPFYRWIKPLIPTMLNAEPNPAHYALAELERRGKLAAIITQNIDGLHQKAGSHTVYELHGHLRTATCTRCGRSYAAAEHLAAAQQGLVPRCACGGAIKPDIILFDELLPTGVWQRAEAAIKHCDLLIVAGTGLEVYPVADLPETALRHGARLIIVNYTPTWADDYAHALLHEDVAVALPQIVADG
ncbi:MAG TPA: NAD-dependent deacylase [Herpetosiphonaceae bacterium]